MLHYLTNNWTIKVYSVTFKYKILRTFSLTLLGYCLIIPTHWVFDSDWSGIFAVTMRNRILELFHEHIVMAETELMFRSIILIPKIYSEIVRTCWSPIASVVQDAFRSPQFGVRLIKLIYFNNSFIVITLPASKFCLSYPYSCYSSFSKGLNIIF